MNLTNLLKLTILCIFLMSCGSTNVFIKPGTNLNSKIAIVSSNMMLKDKYDPTISGLFTDDITLQFMRAGFDVVERQEIDQIIKEHKFASSGLLDDDESVRLGKLLNIKYVVMARGIVEKTGSSVFPRNITVKMVDVTTGQTDLVANWGGAGKPISRVTAKLGDKILAAVKALKKSGKEQQ